ncbi:hypothetical protein [Hippea alviniae]|uniref:hypothetical protein n=1 Tax=Hippea alviniae TaxID=1279027 RepID=UPI0003B32EA5|nr:hypothetical protein [Hippea alviniae]
MKKFLSILIVIFVFGFSQTSKADVFDNLTEQIMSKLHIVNGKVIAVNGNKVELNKGELDGLSRNYFVYIYRNLGSFVPLNSDKPVQLKEGIAYANVVKTFEHKAIAVITQGVEREKKYLIGLGIIPNGEKEIIGKPKVGDYFTSGKASYTVAIITRNPYIYKTLKSKLEQTNRFFVIGEDRVQIAIVNNRINSLYEKTAIKRLANVLSADLIITVSTIRDKDLKFKLYNGYSGNVMLANSLAIDKETQLVLNSQPIQTIPPENLVASNLRLRPKLTFWESILNRFGLYSPYTGLQMSSSTYKVVFYKPIGYGTTAFYYGLFDSDNSSKVVITQGSKIEVYRFQWDSFEKLYDLSYGYNIINIDSAKINGKTLIAISNFNRYGALSSAVGYIKDKRFVPIVEDLPYHIRFYNKFSNHPILIAQKASVSKPFYGPIYELSLNTFKPVSELKLPIQPDSFYEFFKVKNDIVFINKFKQLEVYNTALGKVVQTTSYGFGQGERLIQRYPVDIENNEEPVEELYRKASVEIPKAIRIQKENGKIYLLGLRNYMSNHITIAKQHYNAYNLKLFELVNGKLKFIWSSGDVSGRIVGCAKDGDYVLSVIGVPTGFFDRFIRGIYETDRLTAARIEY